MRARVGGNHRYETVGKISTTEKLGWFSERYMLYSSISNINIQFSVKTETISDSLKVITQPTLSRGSDFGEGWK